MSALEKESILGPTSKKDMSDQPSATSPNPLIKGAAQVAPVASMLIGVLLSCWGGYLLHERNREIARVELHRQGAERSQALLREMETAVMLVEALAAFYNASEEVTGSEFREFTLPLLRRHRGLIGLSLNRTIEASERSVYEASLAANGVDPPYIWQFDSEMRRIPASPREWHSVVDKIEPRPVNRSALGFDIASEPVRAEAVRRAIKPGAFACSGPVTNVQEAVRGPAFLVLGSVGLRENSSGSTRPDLVAGVFSIKQLLAEALESFEPLPLVFEIMATAPDGYVYPVFRTLLEERPPLDHIDFPLEVEGQMWVLRVVADHAFLALHASFSPWWVVAVGMALSTMLAGHLHSLHRMNLRLLARDHMFELLAGNIQEVFWVLDTRSSKYTYISPAYAVLFEEDPEYALADAAHFFDKVPEDYRAACKESRTSAHHGKPARLEYPVLTAHAEELRWLSDSSFPVRSQGGAVVSVVGVIRDITLQRREARQRDEKQEQLAHEQKMHAVAVLAGGVAHDFNNLLTAILGHTEIALATLPDTSPCRADLEEIRVAAQRSAELTARMLDFSGQTVSSRERVFMDHVLREAIGTCRVALRPKAVIRHHIPPSIPPVRGNPGQLRRMLENVLTNAMEATERDGGIVQVGCRVCTFSGEQPPPFTNETSKESGTFIEITISDNGSGIAPEQAKHLFEPFFTTKFDGRGLGLASTRGILRAHGGDIAFTSDAVGTTFTLWLPIEAS